MEEFQLLKTLFNKLEPRFISGIDGPGDDCAIFSSSKKLLISQDVLVEGVHFKLSWSSPRDVAWKALATNESDIASMGGIPIGYTIGLIIPEGYAEIVAELYIGFNEYLLQREDIGFAQKILGGDISAGPAFSISVSVLGECDNPVLRSSAKEGDLLVVSGPIGLAGVGLGILSGSGLSCSENNFDDSHFKELAINKHKRPNPRTDLGSYLSQNNLATSMIDVSDGFIQDVSHLARQSNLTALIDPKNFVFPVVSQKQDLVNLLNAGDDYELIFSVSSLDEFILIKEKFPEVFLVGQMNSQGKNSFMFLEEGKAISLNEFVAKENIDAGYQHIF